MDYFTKHKFLVAAIIILIIVNLGTIGIILFSPHPPFPPNGMKPGMQAPPQGLKFFEDELRLTGEQKTTFIKLRDEHFAQVRGLVDSMQKAKAEAYHELMQDNPDNKKADSLFEVSGKLQIQLDKMTFEHFAKLKSICTKDQLPAYNKLLEGLSQRFLEHDGPPHPAPMQ
jgi:Spy/CpxP family protein refolding chaperone